MQIAFNSLRALFRVVRRCPPAITLPPSPIIPSSSPPQQYSGLSFLGALTKRVRIVFTEFQANLPTNPSHLPKYAQLVNHDPLSDPDIRLNTSMTVSNIVAGFPSMKKQFMSANLVGRIILCQLTIVIAYMIDPIGGNEAAYFEQYPLIRVSVFEPAKQFITFIFHNSNKLILKEEHKIRLDVSLCRIHNRIQKIELRSDEHDARTVSELVKFEISTMVEMETEEAVRLFFNNILNRTQEWDRDQRERQRRREVLLREEGCDDAFELRVVGMRLDTHQRMKNYAIRLRITQTFNADRVQLLLV
ncbi:hypothetical protein BLNAU_18122 [Blattamonas nauphoetae]|uniref:Prohibitin n=1 Tax=Blattamonas nauphoetae TaxID=2049346 RepID=A0ABQ9X5B4_9EUKA|nr:hypothetical protein BLNAU_18122 [Blattamonas nauphoetae]